MQMRKVWLFRTSEEFGWERHLLQWARMYEEVALNFGDFEQICLDSYKMEAK